MERHMLQKMLYLYFGKLHLEKKKWVSLQISLLHYIAFTMGLVLLLEEKLGKKKQKKIENRVTLSPPCEDTAGRCHV